VIFTRPQLRSPCFRIVFRFPAHACILSSVHIALDNRVFYREARSLVKAGYTVTLIAVHDRDEIRDGVQVRAVPRVPRWQRPRLWGTLIRLARATGADIFHYHDPELLLIAPILRALTGKPVIYDVHEVYPDFIQVKDYMPVWVRYPAAWVFRWLEPLLARFNSALIFSDDEIGRAFAHLDMPKETLFNFPARFFVEAGRAATEGLGTRAPVVLHLGGHERNRGTRLMVRAFAQVHAARPEARLVLVGHFVPPELEAEVRADVAAHGLGDAVTMVGRVPFEAIGAHLARAAVGWVPWGDAPKNDKNIPTKLFEYMAYGVPVVSGDLRSTRPFVRAGENGWLVAPNDPGAHAAAILRLLADPARAAEMGRAGQALAAAQFNWDAEEVKLWGLYARLLGE